MIGLLKVCCFGVVVKLLGEGKVLVVMCKKVEYDVKVGSKVGGKKSSYVSVSKEFMVKCSKIIICMLKKEGYLVVFKLLLFK